MSFEAALYSGLVGHAGLAALVGTRVYPMRLPANVTFPAITYERVSTPREHTINNTPVAAEPRFQFDIWAENDYAAVLAVAEQLNAAIRALPSSGSVTVHERTADEESDRFEPEAELSRRTIEAVFLHEGDL